MSRQLLRWAVVVAAFLGSIAMAAPASAATYRYPPNTLSPQFRDGTCIYRIWYGNYGGTPFAKVRLYGGDCGELTVRVAGQRGDLVDWYTAPRGYSGGQDSCGSYFEKQATANGAPAFAVGMQAYFPATGHDYVFWHDSGRQTTPYRYC